MAIFYCLRFEISLFVASYGSQGYGGGIRPRLHTGVQRLTQLFSLYSLGAAATESTVLTNSSIIIEACLRSHCIETVAFLLLHVHFHWNLLPNLCLAIHVYSGSAIPALKVSYHNIVLYIQHLQRWIALVGTTSSNIRRNRIISLVNTIATGLNTKMEWCTK
jgi:hypothetical protein